MLKIKLYEYGLENSLEQIKKDLKTALGMSSKRQKDKIICEVLGMVDALCNTITVYEDDEIEEESK